MNTPDEEEDRVVSVENFGESSPPPQEPTEHIDRATGEITEKMPEPERAFTGEIIPSSARSAGAFVDLLEDGAFSMDAHAEVRDLMQSMTDIANATGQKVKGKVTLTIDLTKEGEAFTVQGKVAVKAPDMPRPKSIMWADDAGNPCRFPPRQVQMFGGARAPIRRV